MCREQKSRTWNMKTVVTEVTVGTEILLLNSSPCCMFYRKSHKGICTFFRQIHVSRQSQKNISNFIFPCKRSCAFKHCFSVCAKNPSSLQICEACLICRVSYLLHADVIAYSLLWLSSLLSGWCPNWKGTICRFRLGCLSYFHSNVWRGHQFQQLSQG